MPTAVHTAITVLFVVGLVLAAVGMYAVFRPLAAPGTTGSTGGNNTGGGNTGNTGTTGGNTGGNTASPGSTGNTASPGNTGSTGTTGSYLPNGMSVAPSLPPGTKTLNDCAVVPANGPLSISSSGSLVFACGLIVKGNLIVTDPTGTGVTTPALEAFPTQGNAHSQMTFDASGTAVTGLMAVNTSRLNPWEVVGSSATGTTDNMRIYYKDASTQDASFWRYNSSIGACTNNSNDSHCPAVAEANLFPYTVQPTATK